MSRSSVKVTHLAVAAINSLTHKTLKTKQKVSNSMPMNRNTLGVIWTPKHRRRSFFFRVWRRLRSNFQEISKKSLDKPSLFSEKMMKIRVCENLLKELCEIYNLKIFTKQVK